MEITPEHEAQLLEFCFPDGVPVRRGVPDAWEIRERLMDISNSRAREAAGRVEESVVMRDLAQHVVTKYGKRLAH